MNNNLVKQFLCLSTIAIQNIRLRYWTTISCALAVSLVCILLMAFLAMSEGFKTALNNTGSDTIAIVLSEEASTELNSQVTLEQIELLRNADGLLKTNQKSSVSPEVTVVVSGTRKRDQKRNNFNLRGLLADGYHLREGFSLREGRMPTANTNEAIIGHRLFNTLNDIELDTSIRLGGVDWRIVGVFELKADVFESEVWADLYRVQSSYKRHNYYQSVRAKLATPESLFDLNIYAANDVRLDLQIISEREFFEKQSENTTNLVAYLAWPLAIILSIGILTGITNTTLVSLPRRIREIKILQQLGFHWLAIAYGVLLETVLCACLGGLLGLVFCLLTLSQIDISAFGANYTSVSYQLSITTNIINQGISIAVAIGVLSGIIPAYKGIKGARTI